MDKTSTYVEKLWDEVANIRLLHMSYLMHILLPRRHLGPKYLHTEKQKVLETFSEFASDDLTFVPVGSKSEGYEIPDTFMSSANPANPYVEYMSDIDVMLVNKQLRTFTTEFKNDGSKNVSFVDTSQTHPGYGRLCFSDPKIKTDNLIVHDKETNKYFLNSYSILHTQLDMIKNRPEDKLEYFIQGPAMSVIDSSHMTYDQLKNVKMRPPQDYVLAIPCDAWPLEASMWVLRKRSNGWLSVNIVETVARSGFHMVPIAHKLSKRPEIEWRISFAKAEQLLAEHAVIASQRQCYLYLKLLRKQVVKDATSLSSYCFKNIFLYCCDELPVNVWEDDPSGCVLYMLDYLLECVKMACVPSYFLPENNLIDHLSKAELDIIATVLQHMRNDPISPVIDFMDSRTLCFVSEEYISSTIRFRSIVQIVLNEIISREHIDITTTILGTFTNVQCKIASVMINETRKYPFTSFWYHLDFYEIFIKKHFNEPLLEFINCMASRFDSPLMTLMFYDKCLEQVQQFPELKFIRGNMACMCFALSQNNKSELTEKILRMKQAERIFNTVLQDNGVHFPSTIDFANFLCCNDRREEAISLLKQFVEAETEKPTLQQNGYTLAEVSTLNEELQNEVMQSGLFYATSLSFALYYLLKASVKTTGTSNLELLQILQRHCETLESYGDYQLLGYSWFDTENFNMAEMAFSKAMTFTHLKNLAKINVDLCRAKIRLRQRSTVYRYLLKCLLMAVNICCDNPNEATRILFLIRNS